MKDIQLAISFFDQRQVEFRDERSVTNNGGGVGNDVDELGRAA